MRKTKPRGDRVKGLVRLRGAAVLAVVPLAALTHAAPLSLAPTPLPSAAAHAEPPVSDPSTPTTPTNSAFEARTTPVAFRSATPTADLPGSAYAAYQRAEAVINASSAGCNLPWELLAAVGQVETDHGRRTPPKAVPTPDSDGGLYDGTAAGDIPVGPLQLTPQAWAAVGVDADGDGNRDAQDIDDAALGLAVLLCGSKEDLATQAGQRTALSQHNQDPGYLDLVLRLTGAYAVPVSISARMVTPTMVSPTLEQARVRSNGKAGGGESSFDVALPAEGAAVAGALDSTPKPTTPPTTDPTNPGPTDPGAPTQPETPPTGEPTPDPGTEDPGTETPSKPGTDEPDPTDPCVTPDDDATEPEDEATEAPATDEATAPGDAEGTDEESECTPADDPDEAPEATAPTATASREASD